MNERERGEREGEREKCVFVCSRACHSTRNETLQLLYKCNSSKKNLFVKTKSYARQSCLPLSLLSPLSLSLLFLSSIEHAALTVMMNVNLRGLNIITHCSSVSVYFIIATKGFCAFRAQVCHRFFNDRKSRAHLRLLALLLVSRSLFRNTFFFLFFSLLSPLSFYFILWGCVPLMAGSLHRLRAYFCVRFYIPFCDSIANMILSLSHFTPLRYYRIVLHIVWTKYISLL